MNEDGLFKTKPGRIRYAKKKITPPAWIVTYDIHNNQLFPYKQPGDKSKLHYCKPHTARIQSNKIRKETPPWRKILTPKSNV